MTEIILKTFATADLLAKEGLNQVAFRTYLTALTASTKQLSQIDFATLQSLPISESSVLLHLFDMSSKCLRRARELFLEANGMPSIPPRASNRPTTYPRPTTPDPDSSSLDSGPLLLLTPPLSTPVSSSFQENEIEISLSSSSTRSRDSSPQEIRKKLDTIFVNPFVKRPPTTGRRTRAHSLVNSLMSRFDTGSEESEIKAHESQSLEPIPTSLTLKSKISSPAFGSNLERYHTEPMPATTNLTTPSLSDEEVSLERALHISPIAKSVTASVVKPTVYSLKLEIDAEDLVPARTLPPPDAPNPSVSIPCIPRSPLFAALLQANKRLDASKSELVLLTREGVTDTSDSLKRLQQTIVESSATLEKVSRLTRVDAIEHTFTFFPPNLIAYQLTLIESTLFHNIPSEALRVHTFRQPHPKIVSSTNFFNFLTRVIESSILDVQEEDDRATTIAFWIQVGETLESIQNFQTLQAVVSGLNTPPLVRLKRTWSRLPKKYSLRLQAIQKLMSEGDNYQNYRRHIDSIDCSSVSVIPYIGVFIMDMTYLSAVSSPSSTSSDEDQRTTQLLSRFNAFLSSPPHSPTLPPRFLKGHGHNKSSSTAFSRNSFSPNLVSNSPTMSFLPFVASLGEFNSTNGDFDSQIPRRKPLQDPELVRQLQLVLTHFILNRAWIPDSVVDRRSLILEPRPIEMAPDSDELKRNTWFSTSKSLPQTFSYLKPSSSTSKKGSSNHTSLSEGLPDMNFQPLNLTLSLETEDSFRVDNSDFSPDTISDPSPILSSENSITMCPLSKLECFSKKLFPSTSLQ